VIKAILADDAHVMRTAIARLLKDCPAVELVAESNSFCGLIHLIAENRPDIVVMDVHMRDEDNISVAELKSCLNGCPLVAISFWKDEETKARADAFGACRLLDKSLLATELIPTIQHYAKRGSSGSTV
jgi:two-component system response regulator DesR